MIIDQFDRVYIVFRFMPVLDNVDMSWLMVVTVEHELETEEYKYRWHNDYVFLQR